MEGEVGKTVQSHHTVGSAFLSKFLGSRLHTRGRPLVPGRQTVEASEDVEGAFEARLGGR